LETNGSSLQAPRAILLSDVHLGPYPKPEVTRDLCQLLAANPGVEFVFVGDTFEFSALAEADPELGWRRIAEANVEAFDALGEHVCSGGKLTFIAGNHDAALTRAAHLLAARFGGAHSTRVVPWFLHLGDVHVEHGHLWDRDNAPLHPLADWSAATEPLGVALMRRFCAAQGAHQFAHAHQTTPVQGLVRTFRLFGWRAPLIVLGYFVTAFALCFEALLLRPQQAAKDARRGGVRVHALAAEVGLEEQRLVRLLEVAPEPTHRRARSTFMRLYFDRIFAAIGALVALVLLASSGITLARLATLGVGVTYLLTGFGRAGRYPGPVDALERASEKIRGELGARVVVFGHTHVEHASEAYVNLGSFAYCRGPGRSYASMDYRGSLDLRYWPRSSARSGIVSALPNARAGLGESPRSPTRGHSSSPGIENSCAESS
jgi:hypothetical protein